MTTTDLPVPAPAGDGAPQRSDDQRDVGDPAVRRWDDGTRAIFECELIRSRRFGRTVGLVVLDGAGRSLSPTVVGAAMDTVRRYDVIVVDARRDRLGVIAPETSRGDTAALAQRLLGAMADAGAVGQARMAVAPDMGISLDELEGAALAVEPDWRAAPITSGDL